MVPFDAADGVAVFSSAATDALEVIGGGDGTQEHGRESADVDAHLDGGGGGQSFKGFDLAGVGIVGEGNRLCTKKLCNCCFSILIIT